jgi:hypothetical protein
MPRLPGRWRWMPACLVMLLAVACSAGAQVAYTPPFAPFTLTVSVDQHGHVSVSASVSDTIVTEVGEFSVGGGSVPTSPSRTKAPSLISVPGKPTRTT